MLPYFAPGEQTGLPVIVRADNNQLVTPTNPLPANDTVVIYLTGLGATTPPVDAGVAAPSNPLAATAIPPALTLRGAQSTLTPGWCPARSGRTKSTQPCRSAHLKDFGCRW
jgi:uncharacterized protein (TIGR03437 family)